MQTASTYDRAAAVLSISCIVHCLAFPALAISLPFVAAAAEAEWVHWFLAALAIAASGMVVARSHTARTLSFLVPAVSGITLISAALFAENFGLEETPPTVVGGVLLAAAHIYRLIRQK